VNLSKTVGVCVAAVGLVVSGCSAAPETEFERTLEIAKTGDAVAQFNLGYMYDEGTVVPQDDVEAVKWYRMAAEQGYAAAQTNLGAMYQAGTGVPRDDVEAVKWFLMAAEQGQAEAQGNLRKMLPND
jgi:TPR repeat protein